jgi:hypothetical protein
VLDVYQTHLAKAAQRVLAEHGDAEPPAYEQIARGGSGSSPSSSETPPQAIHARPGHGPGDLEGLSRRGAVRIPESRRVRMRDEAHEDGAAAAHAVAEAVPKRQSRARAGVPARKPVPTPAAAGERVQRERVGEARRDSGSVSSRTRSRSIRRRGSGVRGSLSEFAYVGRLL